MIGARIAAGVLTAVLAGAVVGCAPAQPQPAEVSSGTAETLTPLVQQALPDVPGRTFTSAIVAYPPGAKSVAHRHGDAFLYVYVLEGTVRSQLEGEPARTYHPGDNWTEQPGAHHVTAENASPTAPAKLLVVFVSATGAELKTDDPHR